MKKSGLLLLLIFIPGFVYASGGNETLNLIDLTSTIYGYLGVAVFVLAYILVPFEEKLHLRKSKPVIISAGIIWILVAVAYIKAGDTHTAHIAIKHCLLEYAELFLFLLAAMTYINALEERNVFQALRSFLVSKGFSLRIIFWITGILSFLISPIADNLTTALLMGTVVMSVGGDNKKFVATACVNIVVAANAGGAFSPFGDITTLMVWQKGKVAFGEFFLILIPSLVNWLVPAVIMSLTIGKETPEKNVENILMKYGAKRMMFLFILTIITAVSFHNFLHLPPATGMMLGLGFLGIFSFFIKKHEGKILIFDTILGLQDSASLHPMIYLRKHKDNISEAVENFNVPTFIINNKHEITHWNKAIEELTGASSEKMIGTMEQWVPFYPEKRPLLADLIVDKATKGEVKKYYSGKFRSSVQIESAYEAKDFFPGLGGTGKWLFITAAPVKDSKGSTVGAIATLKDYSEHERKIKHFDVMKSIARAEWDTLLFFYGIILGVGGLAQFGYLGLLSGYMYHDLGPTVANSLVGFLSAIIDNIPVMFAVLTMDPPMSQGQWLLVTLAAGAGGSMLAIGSAAGVALLGTARGVYTFGSHLKWFPAIAAGYLLSILCHLVINAKIM